MGKAFKITLSCAILCALCGCKTRYITTEVPVELHDTISVVKTVHNTGTIERVERIHTIDTMSIDTSTIATLGMPTLRHNRTTIIDNTLKQSHHADTTNTIERIIEKPVVVKKTEYVKTNVLHWWQSALMWLGMAAMLFVGIWLAWLAWRVRK